MSKFALSICHIPDFKMQPRIPNQSLSSYILNNLDEIERLISNGVYQESLCQQFIFKGKTPSLGTFKTSLARARQKKKQKIDPAVLADLQARKFEMNAVAIPGKRLSANEFSLLEQAALALPEGDRHR